MHGNGPLLILAGAGSGKTSTMTYRIAHLVADRHVPASAVLGLSFTNKAATELRERVSSLITEVSGKPAKKGLTISTFHSLCARFLRAHAENLGFQNNFSILDQNDQLEILKSIFKNMKIDDRKFDLGFVLFEIGQAKNRFLNADKAAEYFHESGRMSQDYALAASEAFPKYQDQLRVLNAMDFDDLLYYSVKLFEEHPEVREHYNARFRHILVDEYQDTNPAQSKLLKLLTERQQNICVVGDDDQSIYSWRGADPTHILNFSRSYPNAKVITLDQNYRSTNTILEAANSVISNNSKRHAKQLWSDRGLGEPITEIVVEDDRIEAELVAEEIQKRARDQQRPWKDFAILYRSNPQSRLFEEALRRHQVPYKLVGALSFLERKEVKDTLAYWKLIANPREDASLRRVFNWPARGIGKTTIETLGNFAFEQSIPLFEALHEAPRKTPRGAAAVLGLRDLIEDLRASLARTPAAPTDMAQWARASLEKIGVKKAIFEDNDDPVVAERKWENVEELVHSLGQMRFGEDDPFQAPIDPAPPPSMGGPLASSKTSSGLAYLSEFIARMTLQAQDDQESDQEQDQEKNQVTLLTLHGSKGLEFPVVFLVGTEEGYLPHRRTIEEASSFDEERRLAYVGITRAKDHLILTRAKNRIRYGKAIPRLRSRFLDEIPKHLIVFRDESHSPDLSTREAQLAHEEKVKGFLETIRAQLLKNP